MSDETIIAEYAIYEEEKGFIEYLARFNKDEFIPFMKDIYPDETFETIMRCIYIDEDIVEAKRQLDYEEANDMILMYYIVEYKYEYDELKKVAFYKSDLKSFMEEAYPEYTFEKVMKEIYNSEDTLSAMDSLYYEEVI